MIIKPGAVWWEADTLTNYPLETSQISPRLPIFSALRSLNKIIFSLVLQVHEYWWVEYLEQVAG